MYIVFIIVIVFLIALLLLGNAIENQSNNYTGEYDNDEYDFGHNVNRYHMDGEGDENINL